MAGTLMARATRAGAGILLVSVLIPCVEAADWELDLDARLVSSDGQRSFVHGGLGTLRYDSSDSGLRLGRARLALSEPIGETWSLRLDASSYGDHDRNPVDLTEGYLQFRPYPVAGYRLRVKMGAFYAPISLENRSAGWDSPYTLSYSALNSWIGKELRTIGIEAQTDWLGQRTGHDFDVGLVGGLFGWNEGAGTVLADRGFSLDDRQSTLFGRVGAAGEGSLPNIYPFREIDGHAGFYAGIETRYLDRLVLRSLHYDNKADPTSLDSVSRVAAWKTSFDSAGLRAETPDGWTAIAQWLHGETYIAPLGNDLEWPFTARFVLISRQLKQHRLSLRYDSFDVDGDNPSRRGVQHGHAWTAAYVCEPSLHWRLSLEWLRVWTDAYNRPLLLGEAPFARETQLQLAVRYTLRSHL